MHHIEVLVEDSSGAKIVDGLMRSILSTRSVSWTYELRRHRGAGKLPENPDDSPKRFASGLLQLLPARLRVYRSAYSPSERNLVIVVLDSDNHPPALIYSDLIRLRAEYAGDLPVVIGVAVEELESWLLADRAALLAAYPEIDQAVLDRYEQDSIVGTWEVLARAIMGHRAKRLIQAGYPAVGTYKYKWAEAISPQLDAKRNVSPSFHRFHDYLLKCLDQLETR